MVRVAFIHPDLGIGGAERAVVDAALALKSRNHEIKLFTAHHDVNHCFEETKSLSVIAVGDWLPRSLLGRFYALFAYIRMIYVAMYLVFFSGYDYDVVYCDQISACIPILKLNRRTKILFYCHFPDLLLTERKTCLKRWYRIPLDWIEEKTTGMADVVLVNSNFTAGIFSETFRSLKDVQPDVLYPVPSFHVSGEDFNSSLAFHVSRVTFLSINRYERKKNLSLAIEAMASLKNLLGNLDDVQLVIAGGYDERVSENKEYHDELLELTAELDLKDHVSFYKSISSSLKLDLLRSCTCLLYTPDREHFGIVPIEAMYYGLPVIAVNSGGPMESVKNEVTGFLCDSTPEDFAEKMMEFVKDRSLKQVLGAAARERVVKNFSFEVFTEKLDLIVSNISSDDGHKDRQV